MGTNDMKKCPFCAEMIKTDAAKCRYCGSKLSENNPTQDLSKTSEYWCRLNEGKRVAGVCTGIAHQFNAPHIILPLRLFFILTTIFYGFGLVLYIVLWILMPRPVDLETNSTEIKKHTTASPANVILSFFLIAVGIALVAGFLFKGHIVPFPIFGHLMTVPFSYTIHPWFWAGSSWIPFSLVTILTVLGLFILLIGGLKFVRFFVGCGLILIGTVFIFLFVPFLPKVFLIPSLLIVGLILIVIGGLKLMLGS